MYNLTVHDDHDYFVGSGQWLVHNCAKQLSLPGIPNPPPDELLPGEGSVGRYGIMSRSAPVGDGVEANHIPQNAYMEQAGPGNYSVNRGIAINMEERRHALTITYSNSPDLFLTPRQALAQDIWDVRSIYMSTSPSLYGDYIRSALQAVIRENKLAWPGFFR